MGAFFVVATALMIAFSPWSVPFWVAAILIGTWASTRLLARLR